jgi:3-deoxy-manno-octulosonate cytidylyltransferase (CMP-KDO synthetase)
MSVAILIPARYGSSRFSGKPLAYLTLPDSQRKTLLHLTWEAALAALGAHPVHILTDDARIRDAAAAFGASVIMMSLTCRNATERCAEAAETLDADILVNLQGDAPLTPPWFIDALVSEMQADLAIDVATPVLRCDPTTYAHLREDRQNGRVGATTSVFDIRKNALYFSKELLPWLDPTRLGAETPVWHHVGIYAYRKPALAAYASLPEGRLEALEVLEQLRFLEHGHTIQCVEVEARGRVFWELNNPEDIPRIEAALKDLT